MYLLINGSHWEDIILFESKEQAIERSIKNPTSRIEVFSMRSDTEGYTPTYTYYKNGEFHTSVNIDSV
jgi:hypothetical protein